MIVSELQYFPPITFFITLYKESYVVLDVYEMYRKMSFRNRCMLAGAQGIISLSIPLMAGRNQHLPVNEVLISATEGWQDNHFKSIVSAYNRSPFFEFYRDEMADMYKMPVKGLMEWNILCMNWLKKKIEWPAEIRFSSSAFPFQACGIRDERDQKIPKNYDAWNPVSYRQVFEERTGFFPNLSILDLLFNVGPRSGDLLRNSLPG